MWYLSVKAGLLKNHVCKGKGCTTLPPKQVPDTPVDNTIQLKDCWRYMHTLRHMRNFLNRQLPRCTQPLSSSKYFNCSAAHPCQKDLNARVSAPWCMCLNGSVMAEMFSFAFSYANIPLCKNSSQKNLPSNKPHPKVAVRNAVFS